MTKKLVLFLVLTVALSLLVNIFAGPWISAKLSSLTLFEKYRILNPQAPIVISKREEPKAGDPTDMQGAVNKVKSRLSSVATVSGNNVNITGSAINLSADGYFLTVQSALTPTKDSSPVIQEYIILNNGQKAQITQAWGETGTNLVIVKADLSNVSVAEFGSSEGLTTAQKIGFVHSSDLTSGSAFFQESFVTSTQNDNKGKVFNSDSPARVFGAQAVGGLMFGEAVINIEGKFVGIWDGKAIVSSDVANDTVKTFFANGQTLISRPQFKFSYRNIGSLESELFQIPGGALVTSVDPAGASQVGGLKVGDSITAVGGQPIGDETSLEEVLQSRKPGEAVGFTVVREKKLITITITPQI